MERSTDIDSKDTLDTPEKRQAALLPFLGRTCQIISFDESDVPILTYNVQLSTVNTTETGYLAITVAGFSINCNINPRHQMTFDGLNSFSVTEKFPMRDGSTGKWVMKERRVMTITF